MAEAKITLTLTPGEFDLLRNELEDGALAQRNLARDAGTGREGRIAKEREARIRFVLERLR